MNQYLGAAGAAALAWALSVNKSLTRLDLGSNRIGVGGVRPLADALKGNATLTELVLRGE